LIPPHPIATNISPKKVNWLQKKLISKHGSFNKLGKYEVCHEMFKNKKEKQKFLA
jgi:hypothetical protein